MKGKNTAVFGIYKSRDEVESAITALETAGFRTTDIAYLLPQNEGTKDLASVKRTKAPEGACLGLILGAILGGVLGWLAGDHTMGVPTSAELLSAGPVVSALAGAGALGLLGALIGALVGSARPEYETVRFQGLIRDGKILLSVHADDAAWVQKAEETLQRTGAISISSTGEAKSNVPGTDTDRPHLRPGARPLETGTITGRTGGGLR